MKYLEMKLKNTAGHKQFFPPLNRTIHAGGVVNILVMCDGNSALADKVVRPYRGKPGWEVFEVLDQKALPTPEGIAQAQAIQPAPQMVETPSKPKEKHQKPHSKPKQDEAKKDEPEVEKKASASETQA